VASWPRPVYHIRVDFNAPSDFVFRWCTDYRRDDGKRAREAFVRRVQSRNGDTIVLQDLWTTSNGWLLNQNRTVLSPPNRWHVDSFGTHRTLWIDYVLTGLPGSRTRLDLTVKRRPTEMYPEQPSRRAYESNLTTMWRNFARSLESDYRALRKRARK
jgi:hypothetical protein